MSSGTGWVPSGRRHCWVLSSPSAKLLTGRIQSVPSDLIPATQCPPIFREFARQIKSMTGTELSSPSEMDNLDVGPALLHGFSNQATMTVRWLVFAAQQTCRLFEKRALE